MSEFKSVLVSTRAPFLILAVACVFLGMSAAIYTAGSVNPWEVVLTFVGGVMAHISVNAFNEYFDFKTKLDERTQRTPFSGGSGMLQAKPHLAGRVLIMSCASAIITALIGVYFIVVRGTAIIPLGVLGLVIILTYTPWLVYFPPLGLVAPGLGFGTAMVNGVHLALTGSYSWEAMIVSFVPFFLVNNLLLFNQFPDAEADQSIGKRHYPITLGKRRSSLIYIAFLALTYVAILTGVLVNVLPPWSLLGLLTLPLAVKAGIGAYRFADGNIPQLMPYLGLNVLINILTPILTGIGLLIS
jgi:1,4-dihydroxy-2-naphthoate octaprenyltransferase